MLLLVYVMNCLLHVTVSTRIFVNVRSIPYRWYGTEPDAHWPCAHKWTVSASGRFCENGLWTSQRVQYMQLNYYYYYYDSLAITYIFIINMGFRLFGFFRRQENAISNSPIHVSNTSSSYAQLLDSLPNNQTMEFDRLAQIVLKASRYLLNNDCIK